PKRGRKAKKSPDATISKSKSSAQSFAPSFTPESAPSFAPSFTPAGSRKRVAQASTSRANRTTAYAQSKNEIRPQRISQSLY
ncbi:transcriptional regulator, partial [Bifidobacteriaceae bacterium WP012]